MTVPAELPGRASCPGPGRSRGCRAGLRAGGHAGDLPDSADLDALTSMLIGSFYGRYVTIAGIPDDWPDRVLSAVWPDL